MILFSVNIYFKSDTESVSCFNSNPKKSGGLHVGQNVASMQERRVH
mgnify:CR=1 FL=1